MIVELSEPARIKALRRDKHGRPVPWFVAWLDADGRIVDPGTPGALPDFRIVRGGAPEVAFAKGLCWVCGVQITRPEPRAFVIGPMCVVNRISAEPPSHYDCARYSAVTCPFLVHPNMTRRERHLPPGASEPPGFMIKRNPGVTAIWVARRSTATMFRTTEGYLFNVGTAQWVEWFAHGQARDPRADR